jgi:hypothetical protein
VSGGADGPRDRPQQEEERAPITQQQEAAQRLQRIPGGGIDPPDEPDEPPPNLADGALLRDQDKPEVWVMCGGARFWVPSSQEFAAMGYDWARVQVVPPGTAGRIPTVPQDGTIFKERTPPEVYFVYSKRKYHVPNPDTFECMRLDWARVRTLPNDSAARVPTVAFYRSVDGEMVEVGMTTSSLAGEGRTPGSLAYPPENAGSKRWARGDLPGGTRLRSRGREVRIFELRGWLYSRESQCNASDPDFGYFIKVDPVFLEERGLDPAQFWKLGDIFGGHFSPRDANVMVETDGRVAFSHPMTKMELNGWGFSGVFPLPNPPTDWTFKGLAGCTGVTWPFSPLRPPGTEMMPPEWELESNTYLRVVGSLVTDSPHVSEGTIGNWFHNLLGWTEDMRHAQRYAGIHWGGDDDSNPNHPARHTEVHPPDAIHFLPQPNHRMETVRGLALYADTDPIGTARRVTPIVAAPPRPSPTANLVWREHVGPETNYQTIIEGNAAKNGANLQRLPGGVRVRVGVKGQWVPGKFKAIYRAYWEPGVVPSPAQPARYGSNVKIAHRDTGHVLHSHAINYSHSGSSKQQQVTCFGALDDNDWWRIKGPHGSPDGYNAGQPVQHGDVIRLEHVLTRKNLHSHSGFPSPVTRQQEVTCFGANSVGDGNDNWRVELQEGYGPWAYGKIVRLVHVPTNHALHSHEGISHPTYTVGQQEVTGYSGRDDNDWWYLFEGG